MKNIYEIFDEYEQAKTDDERVAVLQKNSCLALRQVLRGTFDPTVEFAVTRVPYYKPSDAPPGLGYTNMTAELARVYLFQKEHPKLPEGLTEERREKILIQILEALEAREAVIYMNMILKRQKVKGLNAKIVARAFPYLLAKNDDL